MNLQQVLIEAYNKGYRINLNGDAVSPKGNILRRRITNKDKPYYCFSIKIDDKTYNVKYHRLVAYQKYGDLLFMADCVRHLNGNSLDNSYDNIEIGSYKDNQMDREECYRIASAIHSSKIKYYNVDEIREYYKKIRSYSKTMEKFGISSKGTLFHILNNRVVFNEQDKVKKGSIRKKVYNND